MSATNTTTNLGLSQFVNTDVPAWRQDYNGDMLKIDNAYTADISGATAETSADPSDYMKFYDVSATTNKKILISDLLKGAKVEDLTDTDITTPVDDDGLVYDATAQKWENVPIVTQAQNRVTGVHQFLYNRVTSAQVVGGLTIIPNADGSFTVGAGTATSNAQLLISGTGTGSWSQAEQKLPIGEYYATCEGGTAGIYLKVMVEENNQQKTVYGSGQESFVVSSAPSNLIALIQVISGAEVPAGGITLKPLLRLQSDSSKEIAPYTKTNRELTEELTTEMNNTGIITKVTSGNSIENNGTFAEKYGKIVVVHIGVKFSANVDATVKIATMRDLPLNSQASVQTSAAVVGTSTLDINGNIYLYNPRLGWTYSTIVYVCK